MKDFCLVHDNPQDHIVFMCSKCNEKVLAVNVTQGNGIFFGACEICGHKVAFGINSVMNGDYSESKWMS